MALPAELERSKSRRNRWEPSVEDTETIDIGAGDRLEGEQK